MAIEQKYCQSCAMPLSKEEDYGTNQDGRKNEEYCRYCYKQGAFTSDCTMEQMILHCVQFLDEFNRDSKSSFTREEAIANMSAFFPTLRRWAGK